MGLAVRNLLALAAGASCLLVAACSDTQTEETIAEPITATAAAESGAEESAAETEADATVETAASESSESQRGLPLPLKSETQCTEESLQESFPGKGFVFTPQGCIGNFAEIGPPGTDSVALVRWTGEKWEFVPADGKVDTVMAPVDCWTEESIEKLGIPADFKPHICGRDYIQGL